MLLLLDLLPNTLKLGDTWEALSKVTVQGP